MAGKSHPENTTAVRRKKKKIKKKNQRTLFPRMCVVIVLV